jgi:hypothetical protein
MSQPPPYNRLANFTNYALAHPSAPYNPSDHDAELNAIETTVDALCTNIALIQRDDGELANESVGIDQLETELRALIAVGDNPANKVEPWTTGHSYIPGDAVSFGVDAYLCVIQHVAGVFAVDLGAGKWVLIGLTSIAAVNQAALVTYAPNGTISSTNVQAALTEVAADAAAATAAVQAGAIPLTQKAAANGVATLDATVKVPVAQLPDLSGIYLPPAVAAATYIPLSQKAQPLGVATLDPGGIVPLSQLPTLGAGAIFVQDAEPVGLTQGIPWYESDTGGYYMRYQNPDLTFTFVALAAAGGDFIPMSMRGAANGVASLDAGTKVPLAQLPTLPFLSGQVLQVVTVTDAGNSHSSTALLNLNGVAVTIVPKSASSKILVQVTFEAQHIGIAGTPTFSTFRLFDFTSSLDIGAGEIVQANQPSPVPAITNIVPAAIAAAVSNAVLTARQFVLRGRVNNAGTIVGAFKMQWVLTEIQN